jgi:hypothetical protein
MPMSAALCRRLLHAKGKKTALFREGLLMLIGLPGAQIA